LLKIKVPKDATFDEIQGVIRMATRDESLSLSKDEYETFRSLVAAVGRKR
jgi:hypothetical protein